MANKTTEKNRQGGTKGCGCKSEDVQRKAYELFEKRGRQPGNELDDWFNAEKLLMSKVTTVIDE